MVNAWAQTHDVAEVERALSDLLDSYERDFAKHAGAAQFAKISAIWQSLPSQLARENKKFLYGLVRKGARAREYEDAIEWLRSAGLVHRVGRIEKPGIPLNSYVDKKAFKLYSLDVGCVRRMARLDPSAYLQGSRLFEEFEGALAENYVLQELVAEAGEEPLYWMWDKPKHEVDFIVQHAGRIVPCEVKAGGNVTAKSLAYYRKKYADRTPIAVRYSLRNLALDGGVLNIPLYLASRTFCLLDATLKSF